MEISIQRATTADIPQMIQWARENRELWPNANGDWYTKEDLISWIKNGAHGMLVARAGNQLVGMCLSYALHGWAYCDTLFIDPNYRRHGVATKLLESTANWLKTKQIKTLSLQPNIQNKIAIAFYKSAGFIPGFTFLWMDKKL